MYTDDEQPRVSSMTRDPSTETRQTLVIEMTGELSDIHHYGRILLDAAWAENRDSARLFDRKIMIFPKDEA